MSDDVGIVDDLRGIVVCVSGFTHVLSHVDGFTECGESLQGILAPLVAVQDQSVLCRTLGIQCLLQVALSQVAGNVSVRYYWPPGSGPRGL